MADQRRKKGEGTIIEYSPGKWLSRIKINGKQFTFYGETEKAVARKLKDFKSKLAMGKTDHKRISYESFLTEDYLQRKKLSLKPQSYYRLESTVMLHVIPLLGFYDVDKIDTATIQDDVINPKSKELSYSSVKKIYDAINSSMKYAKSKGKIVHNPVELVVLPASTSMVYRRKRKAYRADNLEIFTDDEIHRFVVAVNATYSNGQPVYRNGNLFLFMLNTGLRVGEATGTKWSDYDAKSKTIRVSTSIIQIKDDNGKFIIAEQDSLKTIDSERILKLNSNAIDALPLNRTGEYIYCTKDGKPLRPRSVQNTLDSILLRAGIPHKSTHVFRHTFASKLFEKGYDVKIVSELLGHSSVKVTYNTYITLIKKQKAQAMESIEDMY